MDQRKYLQLQVRYRQGMVKTFVVPEDASMRDFVGVAQAIGRFSTIRVLPEIDAATAAGMAGSGEAALVEPKRRAA